MTRNDLHDKSWAIPFQEIAFRPGNSSELFQKAMDEMLTGCNGTFWYLDDIIIEGKDIEEHDLRLEKVH